MATFAEQGAVAHAEPLASDCDDIRLARIMAEADQLRSKHKALKLQLEQSEAEKRRLQGKLVNPSPVARKQRDLLVQTQTEAAVLRRKLQEVTSERDAVMVTKAALQAQVAQLMELAAQAAEGQRAAARAAVLQVQLSALCTSVGAGTGAGSQAGGGGGGWDSGCSEEEMAALCVWISEASERMALMASQLQEAEAGRRALQEQLARAQQQAAAAGAAAVSTADGAAAGAAPQPSAPAVVLPPSPIDGRLDARATSTLIWGADGAAALPFASPTGSPAVTHRSLAADGDAGVDAAAGSAARDQGAPAGGDQGGGSAAAGSKPGEGGGGAASAAASAAGDRPGTADSGREASDGSFATAASAAGGAAAATPVTIASGPPFPGFSTPLSRLPASVSGPTPPNTGATLGALSALRNSITPRRLLPSPRGGGAGGGGLAALLGGSRPADGSPREGAAGGGGRRLDVLEGCPLLSPVRASDLGADAAGRGSPLAGGARLRQVPLLWGRPEGAEEGAAAAAAAAVRAVMALASAAEAEAEQGSGSEQSVQEEEPVQETAEGAHILAGAPDTARAATPERGEAEPAVQQHAPAPPPQRRRRRGRRFVRLALAAALVGAAGVAAGRARPDLAEVVGAQSARAWEASKARSLHAWDASQALGAAAWQASAEGCGRALGASRLRCGAAWRTVRARGGEALRRARRGWPGRRGAPPEAAEAHDGGEAAPGGAVDAEGQP